MGTIKTLSPSQRRRRENALERLKHQLNTGMKVAKNEEGQSILDKLTPSDIKRINKEISILEAKLS